MNVVNIYIDLLNLFFIFAQGGGRESVNLIFSSTPKQIKMRQSNEQTTSFTEVSIEAGILLWGKSNQQEKDIRIAMPAQTNINSANEIKTKWSGFKFKKRLSHVDTGTDAYLR
jgi:hypothetical protein